MAGRDDGDGEGDRAELLRRAKVAAADRDPEGMFAMLERSGFLSGVTRQLRAKWPRFATHDVDAVVAEAINTFYVAVTERGTAVSDVGAYIWKVADRGAVDRYRVLRLMKPAAEDIADLPDNRSAEEAAEEVRLRHAVRTARRLLPQVGQHNVQAVMSFLLECIEQGRAHVTADEVGDAVGLGPATARALMSRGFQRLKRLARELGPAGDEVSDLQIDEDDHGDADG